MTHKANSDTLNRIPTMTEFLAMNEGQVIEFCCRKEGNWSQVPKELIIDFLPALKGGDSFCKRLKSQTGYVPSSINVAVVFRAAQAA